MSKLYKKYIELKKTEKDTIYLFKVGVFYLFLDEDAKRVSELLGLKCTHLNDEIMKCGFPIDSLDKYLKLLEQNDLKIMIIDKEEIEDNHHYTPSQKMDKLLKTIKKEDINKMSGIKALQYIKKLKDLL